ncbi:MAG: VWA domain-containing protein [Alphaproteobacteria bacterium]|nr:VWA domain-containing protein [Alphaproteobacteria bacterium]
MTASRSIDPVGPGEDGTLVANIVHFARILRGAGLPIGPGRAIEAVRAVEAIGLATRDDFYWTLHAVFVNRRDQREVFDQAFRMFWRDPQLLERMLSFLLPQARGAGDGDEQKEREKLSRRLAEAFQAGRNYDRDPARPPEAEEPEQQIDAVMTWSSREILQQKDFEQMSNAELAQARLALTRLKMPFSEIRTRRFKPSHRGTRIDFRATLRDWARHGGESADFARRHPRTKLPPLVVLCDISGSMERYTRMFLHFLHALTNDRARVHTFLFGTRLTNITRQLRQKDPDKATAKVADAVQDWAGGTRIGHCLAEFNLRWARRTLGQNATVLLITDGLDRDAAVGLKPEIERLSKSCRRLIWLNPLLRYAGFEPKSSGARAILPYVDDFRPAHNLASLGAIADALSQHAPAARRAYRWEGRSAAA